MARSVRSKPAQPNATGESHQSTILVVEDEAMIRDLVAEYLQIMGYRAVEAANASEAIALLEGGTPIDLTFSDIAMPGQIDGLGLAAWVHAHRRNIPVVLTSGNVCQDAVAAIGDAFLRKPYRMAALICCIKLLLDKTGS